MVTDVNENEFEKIMPADVCEQVEVFTHVSVHVSDDGRLHLYYIKTQPRLKRNSNSKKYGMNACWNKNASFKKSLETISNIKLFG